MAAHSKNHGIKVRVVDEQIVDITPSVLRELVGGPWDKETAKQKTVVLKGAQEERRTTGRVTVWAMLHD